MFLKYCMNSSKELTILDLFLFHTDHQLFSDSLPPGLVNMFVPLWMTAIWSLFLLSTSVAYPANDTHWKVKVKVKQSRHRPGVAQRVPGSSSSQDGGKIVSLTHRPPLPPPPQEMLLVLISVRG